MNTQAAFVVRQINEGKAVSLEQLNWQAITDNWDCGTLRTILDKIDSKENWKRVIDCILSLSAYNKILLPDSFINELENRYIFCEASMEWEKRNGIFGNEKEESQIDERLEQGGVKKMLDALEAEGYCKEWREGRKKRLCAVACQLIQEKVEGEFRPTNGTYEFRPFEKYFGLKGLAKTYGNIENIESVKEYKKVKKIIDKVMP